MKAILSCFAFVAYTAMLASGARASAVQAGIRVLDAGGKNVPATKMGRTQVDDPLVLLVEEVKADILTLALRKPRSLAEEDAMDDLKDFLAITNGVRDGRTPEKRQIQSPPR